jgi:hypothetical protein
LTNMRWSFHGGLVCFVGRSWEAGLDTVVMGFWDRRVRYMLDATPKNILTSPYPFKWDMLLYGPYLIYASGVSMFRPL